MEWAIPKDVTDIWYFMVLTRYYWRLIQGFSKIAYPITSLHIKGLKFVWYVKCEEDFENLK